jgi:hypothetical protein
MTPSDCVLIGTTLLLSAIAISVAIFGPYWGESFKNKVQTPKLFIQYKQELPFCKKLAWINSHTPTINAPVYFFLIHITNNGKSQARKVEASIEELFVRNEAGDYQKLPKFSPFKLRYDEINTMTVDINPRKSIEWSIGHISSLQYQQESEKQYFIDVPNKGTSTDLRFKLEQMGFSYAGPNCLAPGHYRISISVNSENADTVEKSFNIDWSGKWSDTEEEMYREIVITPID